MHTLTQQKPELRANFATATDFLDGLNGGGDLTFTTQQTGGGMRELHNELPSVGCDLERRNYAGENVYVTVNRTDLKGRKADNIEAIRALFIDCDGFNPTQFHLTPSIVVQSKNGQHVYWLLKPSEAERLDRFSNAQKALAQHYGSDPKVHDLPRLMRLPGFYHMKDSSQPFMVELVHIDPTARYTIEEVLAGLRPTEDETLSLPQEELQSAVRASAEKVRKAKEGNRNHTLYQQAIEVGRLVHRGVDKDLAYSVLMGAALECGLQPMEIEKTWKSGLANGIDRAAKEPLFCGVGDRPTSKAKQLSHIITADYAGRLSYDVDDNVMCLDGVGYDFAGAVHREIAEKYDVDIPIGLMETYLRDEALKHRFSPVAEYLTGLPEWDGFERVSRLAAELFGADHPMHQMYLTKFGISAVARALDPGCKVDTALILHGPQGVGKTEFFRLLGGSFYDSYGNSTNEKDALMKVQKSWILEMDELEHTFTRVGISALKSFITQRTDKFRAPYARVIEEHPRHCVLVGTTNESEFLADSTGNRRFWIVPVNKRIDFEWLEEHRDQLWAEWVHLYNQGEVWHLTSDQQQQSNELNTEYQSSDPWLSPIQTYLETVRSNQPFTVDDVLTNAIGKDIASITKGDQMRVSKILKDELGFIKKKLIPKGKVRGYYWVHPTKVFGGPPMTEEETAF